MAETTSYNVENAMKDQENNQNKVAKDAVQMAKENIAKRKLEEETLTVEQFKAAMNVSRIDVKQNPKTNRLFFSYGAKVGAVATKGIPEHPMISFVKGEPTENNPSGEFWLLHEEGQGGAPVLASF